LLAWGSQGNSDGQFSEPRGLAVDASGNVFVTDYFPHSRIQVFDANGAFLRKWGIQGSGPGQLFAPVDIALDAGGNAYVVDGNTVNEFTSDGIFVRRWGSGGTGDGQFQAASGIAIDASNNVYVVGNGDCRVQKFTNDGTFLLKWDACESLTGVSPMGVEVEPAGTVLVTILGAQACLRRFSATGEFLGQLGTTGNAPGSIYAPAAAVVDAGGRIYEADGNGDRVQAFSSTGTFIIGWGSTGTGPGQFQTAIGIGLGPGGEIYVSDRLNYRVQKFGSLSTPTLRSTWGRIKSIYR